MQCISENKDAGLLVALVGAPDPYLEKHRLQRLGNSNLALEHILNCNKDYLFWSGKEKAAAPSDWQQLADASGESTHFIITGMRQNHARVTRLTRAYTVDY